MKMAKLLVILAPLLGSVAGLKYLADEFLNVSSQVNVPDCKGTQLAKVVGKDHWQCDSLSGKAGKSNEEKCRNSYDTNAAGKMFVQCEAPGPPKSV